MAKALAFELAANCSALPDCPAGHARHGLARNQGKETLAQCSWAVSVHLQPRDYGGSRVGPVGASAKIPDQNGYRHGGRAVARMATSRGRNASINSPAPSS